eukprot:Amastigsp_a1459_27.p5 type:complete len:154 gc:universal Amastigsp_a1459_27:1615-2076(+)
MSSSRSEVESGTARSKRTMDAVPMAFPRSESRTRDGDAMTTMQMSWTSPSRRPARSSPRVRSRGTQSDVATSPESAGRESAMSLRVRSKAAASLGVVRRCSQSRWQTAAAGSAPWRLACEVYSSTNLSRKVAACLLLGFGPLTRLPPIKHLQR